MISANTPYAIAVGQILLTRMETVEEQLPSLNLGTLSPAEMLPHLLGGTEADNPDIWILTARDMLVRAQARSRVVAAKLNGSAVHTPDALTGPDFIQRALAVWGVASSGTIDEKKIHILGVKAFLEKSLSDALVEGRRSTSIAPPKSSRSTEMPAVIPPAIMAPRPISDLIPSLPEAGLVFLRDLLPKAKKAADAVAYVRDATKYLPQPFAMARMVGGETLGQFAVANGSLLDRYKWRGLSREKHLLGMSLMSWYHPEDRALFATLSFAFTKVILGKPAEIPPRPVRGLSGDVMDYWEKNHRAKPKEGHYVRYQGAGIMSGNIAFGIFTELPK